MEDDILIMHGFCLLMPNLYSDGETTIIKGEDKWLANRLRNGMMTEYESRDLKTLLRTLETSP